MARLPRSPIAQGVSNQYRPVQEARASGADPVGGAMEQVGNAGFEIASRMADAKIAADAAEASIRLRSRLDEEYRAIENDMEGDPSGFEARFRERAAAVANEEAGRMSSPAMKRAFAMKSMEMTETFGISMRDVTRRRQVEGVKAQTMKVGADYEALAKDPAKPRELLDAARDDYLSLIDQQVKAGIYTPDVAEAARIAAREVYQSGVTTRHLTNMDTLLDAGRAGEAEEYFKANYGEIDPAQREKAESVLETKTLESRAITKADEFWSKSGGDYGAAIAEAAKIENPDERLAVESRIAQLKNQGDAAKEAKQSADLDIGMQYVVEGKSPPPSWFRDSDPAAVYTVQERLRARNEQALRVASMTAEQKAAMKDVSEGNYLKLTAQLTDPQLVLAGRDAVLADPGLRELYDNMLPDEQNKFDKMIIDAKGTGGVPADKTLKAYKDVVALVATSMPNYAKDFRGLGEGDPGVARISQSRTKKGPVLDFEGAVMRMVGEELARTGGAEITQDRAKQIAALAFAEAGAKKDGTTKYPIPADVASGIVATEARTQIIEFRRANPELWSETTAMVRSKYPDASDALILAEAQRIRTYRDAERMAGFTRGLFGAGNADE